MSLRLSQRHVAVITALGAMASAAHAASYNPTLPAEPQLPKETAVCKTLDAKLTQTGGRLPDAVDANPDNSQPDTLDIQGAIDKCPAGQAVRLRASGDANAFLSGPLLLKSGVTLWIDSGVTLFASRDPKDFDTGAGRCGTAGGDGKSCNPLIRLKNAVGSRIVGDGIIDGRGGSVLTSGPNAGKMTWWDVANLLEATGKKQNNPRLVHMIGGSDFKLYRVTLQNSASAHAVISGVDGFVAWGTKVLTPSLAYTVPNYACAAGTTPDPKVAATKPSTCFTPETAANTDGINPVESKNVTIAYSFISTGDDHIAIKAADAPASDIYVTHTAFMAGHGMSIGSETTKGVRNVRVDDVSFDGLEDPQSNGIRIKTYDSVGGPVSNVVFSNICMRNMKQPMIFTPYYSSGKHTAAPNINDILLQNIHVLSSPKFGAGKLTFRGYQYGSITNPLTMTLDNVVFDSSNFLTAAGKKNGPTQPDNATLTLGPGPVTIPFASSSTFKIVDKRAGSSAPRNCDVAFPKFPSTNSPI
ncbi:glycoside hydrolase family 28 protein [Roseateles sp. MS654]|uniref:glycoside hydrolase family 28 protein n=1 Tax=Roseateles sp. MS654 TaxID=3412685 RepID=UPI003C2B1AF6